MNENPARVPADVGRHELEELKKRVAALEGREREPFRLRVWHTLFGGLLAASLSLLGAGLTYDHMRDCGLRLSLWLVFGFVGVPGFFLSIATLFGMIPPNRKHLDDPWGR